jgi:hypothetical protein
MGQLALARVVDLAGCCSESSPGRSAAASGAPSAASSSKGEHMSKEDEGCAAAGCGLAMVVVVAWVVYVGVRTGVVVGTGRKPRVGGRPPSPEDRRT